MSKRSNLYNHYRPNCFKQLVGQAVITTTLINSITSNHSIHAYIFSGPRGTGKTSCARILAKAINCLNFHKQDVCNACANCQLINNRATTDVLELDAASNNGVDAIRELTANAQYLPINLQVKVYIIDEAHMLTISAWNALLKIVEEPPAHVLFIFSTTEFEKIIPTIQSRCQKHNFFLLDHQTINNELIKIATQEGFKLKSDAAMKISTLAYGSLRDALSLLGQVMVIAHQTIDLKTVEKALFLVDYQTKIAYLKALFHRQTSEAIKVLHKVHASGYMLESFFHDVISILMDCIIFQQTKTWDLMEILDALTYQSLQPIPTNLVLWINEINKNIKQLKFVKNGFLIAKIISFNLLELLDFQAQTTASEVGVDLKPALRQIDSLKKTIPFVIPEDSNLGGKNSDTALLPKNLELFKPYEHDPTLFKTKTKFISNPCVFQQLKSDGLKPPEIKDQVKESNVFTSNQPAELNFEFLTEDNLIFYTLKNPHKDHTLNLQTKVEQLLESADPLKELFLNWSKQKTRLIASSTSVLVCFDEMLNVLEFNEQIKDISWLQAINHHFKTEAYWVGVFGKRLGHYLKDIKTKTWITVPKFKAKNLPQSAYQKTIAILKPEKIQE